MPCTTRPPHPFNPVCLHVCLVCVGPHSQQQEHFESEIKTSRTEIDEQCETEKLKIDELKSKLAEIDTVLLVQQLILKTEEVKKYTYHKHSTISYVYLMSDSYDYGTD